MFESVLPELKLKFKLCFLENPVNNFPPDIKNLNTEILFVNDGGVQRTMGSATLWVSVRSRSSEAHSPEMRGSLFLLPSSASTPLKIVKSSPIIAGKLRQRQAQLQARQVLPCSSQRQRRSGRSLLMVSPESLLRLPLAPPSSPWCLSCCVSLVKAHFIRLETTSIIRDDLISSSLIYSLLRRYFL